MAETDPAADPQPKPDLPPAAQRALAEAAERRAKAQAAALQTLQLVDLLTELAPGAVDGLRGLGQMAPHHEH